MFIHAAHSRESHVASTKNRGISQPNKSHLNRGMVG